MGSELEDGDAQGRSVMEKNTEYYRNGLMNLSNKSELDDFIKNEYDEPKEGGWNKGVELLNRLMKEKNLTVKQVSINAGGQNPQYLYKILAGERNPKREPLIRMMLGMGLNVEQMNEVLKNMGHKELWPRKPMDAIIIFGINHNLEFDDIEEELCKKNENYSLM